MRKTRAKKEMMEQVGLRGGIEICLKNALTGEDIIHHKGPNVVLYAGRNALMTRAYGTASQASILQPCVQIGSGSVATQYTHVGLTSYFTYKTGGFATTTAADGSVQPVLRFTAFWESTDLTIAAMTTPGIWEFGIGFNSLSNSSAQAPMLARYVSAAALTCTNTNQLYITWNVSF